MEAGSLLRFAAASGRFTSGEAKLAASQASFLCHTYSNQYTWLPFFQISSKKRAFPSPIGSRCFCTDSTGDFFSTPKRRSRGTVMAAKKAADGGKKEEGKCKHTVDLPKTTIGLRANAVV